MGVAGLVSFNGPHTSQMGWLPKEAIQTVTVTGVYKISMLERAAKVPASRAIPRVLRA